MGLAGLTLLVGIYSAFHRPERVSLSKSLAEDGGHGGATAQQFRELYQRLDAQQDWHSAALDAAQSNLQAYSTRLTAETDQVRALLTLQLGSGGGSRHQANAAADLSDRLLLGEFTTRRGYGLRVAALENELWADAHALHEKLSDIGSVGHATLDDINPVRDRVDVLHDMVNDFRTVVSGERDRRKALKGHAAMIGEEVYAELCRADSDQRQSEDSVLTPFSEFVANTTHAASRFKDREKAARQLIAEAEASHNSVQAKQRTLALDKVCLGFAAELQALVNTLLAIEAETLALAQAYRQRVDAQHDRARELADKLKSQAAVGANAAVAGNSALFAGINPLLARALANLLAQTGVVKIHPFSGELVPVDDTPLPGVQQLQPGAAMGPGQPAAAPDSRTQLEQLLAALNLSPEAIAMLTTPALAPLLSTALASMVQGPAAGGPLGGQGADTALSPAAAAMLAGLLPASSAVASGLSGSIQGPATGAAAISAGATGSTTAGVAGGMATGSTAVPFLLLPTSSAVTLLPAALTARLNRVETTALEKAKADTEAQIAQLMAQVQNGTLPSSEYQARLRELELRDQALTQALEAGKRRQQYLHEMADLAIPGATKADYERLAADKNHILDEQKRVREEQVAFEEEMLNEEQALLQRERQRAEEAVASRLQQRQALQDELTATISREGLSESEKLHRQRELDLRLQAMDADLADERQQHETRLTELLGKIRARHGQKRDALRARHDALLAAAIAQFEATKAGITGRNQVESVRLPDVATLVNRSQEVQLLMTEQARLLAAQEAKHAAEVETLEAAMAKESEAANAKVKAGLQEKQRDAAAALKTKLDHALAQAGNDKAAVAALMAQYERDLGKLSRSQDAERERQVGALQMRLAIDQRSKKADLAKRQTVCGQEVCVLCFVFCVFMFESR